MRCPDPLPPGNRSARRFSLALLCVLALLVGLLQLRHHRPAPPSGQPAVSPVASDEAAPGRATAGPPSRGRPTPPPRLTPGEVVAGKLSQFGRSRREFAYALARKHNAQVPGEVEALFTAIESADWNRIQAAFRKINGGDSSASQGERPPGVAPLWPAIIDAYGAAEQVHLWPAQQLLDYGNAVLGALRPDMVYVGGTDNGRWIPELLNDTSDGEHHIIVTQNGLADGTYLDYLRLQYDGRLANLSDEDSQRAFQSYLADAQQRLQHDQQFPDEPKQILPGEDVRFVDGKVEVSGQVAVMSINERLLQMLMQNNPDVSFAIEQSFPFKSTYASALPLGPLMELGAQDNQNPFTAERADQSLDYWRNTAQQVLSDPDPAASESALRSYSHDVVSAADLLAANNFTTQAEEAYRLGAQLWPGNPEPVGRLADLLTASGREDQARQLIDAFAQKFPNEQQDLERISAGVRLLWTVKAQGP